MICQNGVLFRSPSISCIELLFSYKNRVEFLKKCIVDKKLWQSKFCSHEFDRGLYILYIFFVVGDVYIHVLSPGRSPMEEPPSISEGCGGRVTDYRIGVGLSTYFIWTLWFKKLCSFYRLYKQAKCQINDDEDDADASSWSLAVVCRLLPLGVGLSE